jgi:hypothetical protein
MSNVGDALSGGGSSASGISDTTLSDASLGDQLAGGTGDFGTGAGAGAFGDAGSGGNSFSSFNDIANAFTGGSAGVGGTPTAVQSASMTPPAAAGQTGGDPTGAAGGTQSNTAPGATPTDQNQQQQSGGSGKQQDPNYAPPQAVSQLKALLKQLNTGKPAGPTGPVPTGGQNAPFALPTLAAGETGQQVSQPYMPLARQVLNRELGGSTPAAASLPPVVPGETGAQSPQGAPPLEGGINNLPGVAPGQTGPQSPQGADPGRPTVDAQGNPVTAAGTPAADTPLPPARPTQTADAGGGRQITVRPQGGGAQPSADLPTRVPPGSAALPTKKPGPSPAPTPIPQPSRIIQDISGVSTGSPTALVDLAKAIVPMLPLLAGMFMGGGGGRRGGHFHGGRFTHGFGGGLSGFRGGMNAMGHLHGGRHPMAPGAWPYHHEMHGWHMHPRHPGPGLPLNPIDAQGIVGGGGQGDPSQQGGPDPNAPPKETDAPVGPPDQTATSGAIPGVGAKEVDDYTRSVANKWGINPDVASKILAQESSYGQARKPGDNGTSFGPFQLHFAPDGRAMGDDFRRDTGLDPRDPKTWKDQIDYVMKRAAMGGWKPWTTTMNKLGLDQWSGITTNRRFAGKLGQDPTPGVVRAAAMPVPAQLPPSSQPMVSG